MANEDFKTSRAPGERIGNHVIVRLLGRGGMSEVYLGRNVVAEKRVVAIKVLARRFQERPDLRKRLAREAEIYDALDHPNIVRMHDIGLLDDGAVYIVMDLIRGRTLRDHIALGPVNLHGALHIMIEATSAMCFAHRKDVIHRDLKPENIMVTPNGDVKVLDFGIAKFTQGGDDSSEMPKLGTIAFLAPEQIAKRPVDGRADIYALGVIFYIVLSGGRHPFENDDGDTSDAEMIGRHLHAQPRPLREIVEKCPHSVWLIVAKCLAKDPDDRYGTMDDLLEDLAAVITESIPPEHPIAQRAIEEQQIKRASGVQFIAGGGEAPAQRNTEPLVNYVAPARVMPFAGKGPPAPAGVGKGHTEPMPKVSHDTTVGTSSGRPTVLPEAAVMRPPGAVAVVHGVPVQAPRPYVAPARPPVVRQGPSHSASTGAAPPSVAPGTAGTTQPAFSPARTELTPSSSEADRPAPPHTSKRSRPMPEHPINVQAAPASKASVVLMGLATGLTLAALVASIPGFRTAVRAGTPRTEVMAAAPPPPPEAQASASAVARQVPGDAHDAGSPAMAEASMTAAPAASAAAAPTHHGCAEHAAVRTGRARRHPGGKHDRGSGPGDKATSRGCGQTEACRAGAHRARPRPDVHPQEARRACSRRDGAAVEVEVDADHADHAARPGRPGPSTARHGRAPDVRHGRVTRWTRSPSTRPISRP